MRDKIIAFIIDVEVGPYKNGGYTNDPVDAGGETKWGISKRANPDVDIKNLTKEEAIEIYARKYWKDEWEQLGFALAACMMDTAVNGGNGPMMLDLCNGDFEQFLELRKKRYETIIRNKPSQKKYKNGWMNRLEHLRRFINGEIKQG